jgi:SAM-dependent methyltransferase
MRFDAHSYGFFPGEPEMAPASGKGLAGLLTRVFRRLPMPMKQDARATFLRARSRWAAFRRGTEPQPTQLSADCRYCGWTAVAHWNVGRVATTHAGPFECHEYHLLQCTHCDVVYLDPLPTLQDLNRLYQESDQFSGPHYSDPDNAARMVEYYERRLQRLDLLPAPGSVSLEVGAGLAWVSRAIKRRVEQVETWAQDPSHECAGACPWVDHYRVGALESIDAAQRFGFISLTHVIEHVLDPNRLLEQLAARLLPGGSIFLTAPFRPPRWRIVEGIGPWRDYSYLHVPAHIAYLSRQWLQDAAARAGLDVVHWEQDHDGHQALEAVLRRPRSSASVQEA